MAKAKKCSKNSGSAGSKVPSTSNSRGQSEQLKDVEFTFGKSTDTAAFEQTKTTLVRYVGVQSWPGASVASTALEQGTDSYPKTLQGTVKMMTLFEEKGIVGTGGSSGENGAARCST